MPVYFISSRDIRESNIIIQDPLFTHLHKSLRIHEGDGLVLGDEQRCRHHVHISRIEKHQMVAEIQETQIGPALEEPPIILGQSVLKGEKMNWVIQKATELGVATIVPLVTERVISRLSSAQAEHHQIRWQRIALEAAQQAERWDVPTINEILSFDSFSQACLSRTHTMILTERDRQHSLFTIKFPSHWEHSLTLVVGPEGGWTEDEIQEANKAGFQSVSMGGRILRAETAALAALSITQARLGHMQ